MPAFSEFLITGGTGDITTTSTATSDDKADIMESLSFQYMSF